MPDVVPAPRAPLARGDVTRRWGLAAGVSSEPLFPGLTRPEADRYATREELGGAGPETLVAVVLDAVLSDGAGPHLLDRDGELSIALGPHPLMDGLRVAMAQTSDGRRAVGVVSDDGDGLWSWRARVVVPQPEAVGHLDALAEVADGEGLVRWAGGDGRDMNA